MGSWSKRDVNRLRKQMSEQNRSIDEIAGEIRHLAGCSRLSAYRMAHGWSQPEVAERYAAVPATTPMDQPLLSRLEMFPGPGSRAPQTAQLIALASIYQTSPLRLLDPYALDQLGEHERTVLIRCDAAVGLPEPQTAPRPAAPMWEQAVPATTDLERKVEMAARRAMRFAVTVEGSNVGPETLDQLRDEVSRLAGAYPQQPLPALLGDLTDLQDVAFRVLEGRQRPAETRELYLLAGAITGMLAKASHDLGDPHAAMTQARTAYICADNADHHGLRAWTRGLQSMVAYWAGWPHEAVRYAQLGAEPAGLITGTTAVWLPAQEARAWAVLGDQEAASAAIMRAERARDGVRPDDLDALGGILTFTRPRQLYYAADARVWLAGEEHRAEQAATDAITAYEQATSAEQSFSDLAGSRADQALARVRRGELDGAAQALRPVFDLPSEQRIGGITASAMRVHAALHDPALHTASVARDLQQEIEAYSQVPAAAALPRGR